MTGETDLLLRETVGGGGAVLQLTTALQEVVESQFSQR